ncbi:MAG: response regulator [Acidobacteria bacterium]|nr:response regulator [Acidobacteriota bacterium]NIM60160.1 response regulator [Acidobacteriota bacterium]NIO57829.1 response regulator [Acidobacteriota bacterium]NIQ28838.1 response regulator [Acidobacteriota bacterium]NIQ83296.1 response regulator [Acidobacteriota bacterium]
MIVDDEPNVRRVLGTLLDQAGWSTTRAESGEQALDLVRAQDPDLVITDLKMPGMDGMELLSRIRASFPEIPVVMLTAHGTVTNAVEAMKRGAHDFITKPFDRDDVLALVNKALGQAVSGRAEFRGPLVPGERCGIVGRSSAIEELRKTIEKIAPTPATVLIRGETGTGKELVVEALHQLSKRKDKPLVKINCGALPENLVEAELFGHEKGAFTGAERAKPGRFELADGGTLFLDEIGELPAAMQVKLLRVLQDRMVDRVGGTEPKQVDVRLLAATNRDLDSEVAAGNFREDLLYRLKVVELVVPPLRERLSDIPDLVECFAERHAERLERPRPEVGLDALNALMARPWPGNVRELENAVERAVLLGDGESLGPADFGLVDDAASKAPASTLKEASRVAAAQTERRMILAALDLTDGNITRAAERLGLSRRGLQLKMKELELR